MSRWFRFYDDAINDPKILRLSDANFRAWVTLLCLASKNDGVLPSTNDIALVLRMKPGKVAEWLAMLTAAGLIDNDNGLFRPHNWNARQFKSDVSNERVKQHRERKRNGDCNVTSAVTVTAPETEQRQITEQKSSLRSEGAPAKPKRERARPRVPLPDLWQLDAQDVEYAIGRGFGADRIEQMAIAFANNHRGKGSLMADWHAAWRTWVENEIKFNGGTNGNRTGNPRTSGHDAILAVAARKASQLNRNDEMAGPAGTPGFAFGEGVDAGGPDRGRGAAEAGRGDRQRQEPDDQRIREGEIIPPDKDAAGIPRGRQFV